MTTLGVVGAILAGWLRARRDVFLRIASHHHACASRHDGPEADRVWHRALLAKYRRAARYPWLPVEPYPSGST